MGHCINIFIGKKSEMTHPGIKYKELNAGIVAILDWPGNRSNEGYSSSELKKGRMIAEISTNYFGGFGSQSAKLYSNNRLISEWDTDEGDREPINIALRELGIVAEEGKDEFDTVGLGRYRSIEDLLEKGRDEEDDKISSENAAALSTKEFSSFEVAKIINEFYDFSYGGISPETKDKWIKEKFGFL